MKYCRNRIIDKKIREYDIRYRTWEHSPLYEREYYMALYERVIRILEIKKSR